MNELIAVQNIAGWDKLKALVLHSVSSPITKRLYNMALNEFLAWFQRAPRPGFTKATVSAWRVSLEDRRLGSSSIIIRMSAIRKLAAEAAENGLARSRSGAGISRGKSAKTLGIRTGNWLSQRQGAGAAERPGYLDSPGTARSRHSRCPARLWLAVLRGGRAHLRALAAPRRPLVHRRSNGKAWRHSYDAHADLGEAGDRCLDDHGQHRRRLR